MSEDPAARAITTEAPRKRAHLYLSVLGSCATADGFRTAGWPTFVDPGIRVHDYVGRTAFRSLESAGLEDSEWEHTEAYEPGTEHKWGYGMALGELRKRHAPQLLRGARTTDALIFDVCSTFLFRELEVAPVAGDDRPRVLLESWELERFFRVREVARAAWLWEQPYEAQRDAAISFLGKLVEKKPALRLALHLPPICRNDGIQFKLPELNSHDDFYYAFGERLAGDLERAFPRQLTTIEVERTCWRADPEHPYGREPFHYVLDYYVALRRHAKRWLGCPDDSVEVVRRDVE